MSNDLGPGVSRVLDGEGTGYSEVILQQGKPPLDSEFNLLQELASNFSRRVVLRGTPSGFLGNETNSHADFLTNPNWSNWFQFGPQRSGEQRTTMWANVNGWLIPVTGTQTGTPPGAPNDAATWNEITLDPAPGNSGGRRIDYCFLEVWQARVAPDPSSANKPSSSAIYRYGNVEGGASYLADDIVDPALGFETSQRVQLQYRIRVVSGIGGLTTNPDGFDSVEVKAQGAATDPTSWVFENMRGELGDPGLWRAGDGTSNALGTVDGYAYAIPLAAVFRRNSVAWNGDPSQNLNGAFDRNPTAVDRTGRTTFTATASLGAALSSTETVAVDLVTADGIPLPLTPASPVFIKIGDEILTYTAITTGSPAQLTGLTRSLNGTRAEAHVAGTEVQILSGRPDGLFADQVSGTDILDLRHLVNPNGFNHETLLKTNLDRLLRGQLRASWKRTGAGPQGPFVCYQDKIASGAVSLGVTQLDAPDNIRLAFSDAAQVQRVECVITPSANQIPPSGATPVNVPFAIGVAANATTQQTASQFQAGDVITFPVSQLKGGLPGGDSDQVRWVNDGVPNVVEVRLGGHREPLDPSLYTVGPANPTSNDNLTITFEVGFPVLTTTTQDQLHITLSVMYGPGRGLSRRPDSLHSISYVNPSSELLVRPSGNPSSNLESRPVWELQWSKYRSAPYKSLLPATAEAYADLGSKSVVLQPFRRISFPTTLRTMDGTAVNPTPTIVISASDGVVNAGSPTFTSASANFVVNGVVGGEALIITSGPAAGTYTVLSGPPPTATTVTVERNFLYSGVAIDFSVNEAQGLMPANAPDGSAKWGETDPLQLFSASNLGTTISGRQNDPETRNIYTTLPRHLVPGWGEVHVPILPEGNATFSEGVNFMSLSRIGSGYADSDKNFVPYWGGEWSWQVFSTTDLSNVGVAFPYNTAITNPIHYAGMRQFTDSRGLNRQGLELPPFYGIARLFGVFEAQDYVDSGAGTAWDPTTRTPTGGGGTNLLRQSMDPGDGPTFWIEIDEDGDSTFILNSNALDLSRSPNPLPDFASGDYVIEASVFGFDRGSFDLDREFRLVLTRPEPSTAWTTVNGSPVSLVSRADNLSDAGSAGGRIAGPVAVLPGPATGSDQIVVNYSRTPYQGDAWGSQTSYMDIQHQPGPISSGEAAQLLNDVLDEDGLTRPNQKPLEVLASIGFATTLGTGRLSGDATEQQPLDFRDVGYEDPATSPATVPRPRTLTDRFSVPTSGPEVPTEYLGSTERLPLGALYRDKDFQGILNSPFPMFAPVKYYDAAGVNFAASLAAQSSLDQSEVPLDTASTSVGAPGDLLVHVDGEQGNYSLLVNFRTNRGGSVFVAGGGHPGGELVSSHTILASVVEGSHTLAGQAFLVRNEPTSVGSNEVSAGGELMMLIVTQVVVADNNLTQSNLVIVNGTNGSGEGSSAADLYRIEGHPLVRDNVKVTVDPDAIALSKRGF